MSLSILCVVLSGVLFLISLIASFDYQTSNVSSRKHELRHYRNLKSCCLSEFHDSQDKARLYLCGSYISFTKSGNEWRGRLESPYYEYRASRVDSPSHLKRISRIAFAGHPLEFLVSVGLTVPSAICYATQLRSIVRPSYPASICQVIFTSLSACVFGFGIIGIVFNNPWCFEFSHCPFRAKFKTDWLYTLKPASFMYDSYKEPKRDEGVSSTLVEWLPYPF